MVAIETVRSRPPDAPRAPDRPVTADPVALLRTRLAFPREVFDVLIEPLISGLAGCVAFDRDGDAAADAQPLGRSVRLALRALAVRRDRILPPNAPPERVGELAHRWTYAVLLAALLSDRYGPGSVAPDRQYEGVVPELGRLWIEEDPAVSLALADVLAGRDAPGNAIATILREAFSGRSDYAAPSGTSPRQHLATAIDPAAASVPVPVQEASSSGALATHASRASLSEPPLPELFGWLRDGLAKGSIEINSRAALVHHVPEGLLLVSPGIFRSFLAWQGHDANSQEALKRLQRSVLKAGWHLVGADGASVLGYAWTKKGKATARVHGIVIEQPRRLLDPLPPINPRLVRIAAPGGSVP
ncbi:MAG: DNA-binding domain-containing protein [Novosphingobium sp.]|nr:DNA-binding domain-containing protein [Novosphingobium sp.]